jgi:3-oxoacyl-[acyl-carrier-protein] synthase II
MSQKRVVITGVGVITSIGQTKEEFWQSLSEGRSGISSISRFDSTSFPVRIASEVKDFRVRDYFTTKEAIRMDRFTQFALAAAIQAMNDAKIPEGDESVGVIVGSGIGGLETLVGQQEILYQKGPSRVSPFLVPMMILNAACAQIAIHFRAQGYSFAPVTACASSLHALGEAYNAVKTGKARLIITGGAEAPIVPLAMAAFANMKALSFRNEEPQKASRPFDLYRDGFVMGEGAGILILESLESALERGAHIYAEILSYACSTDAYHITAPEPSGQAVVRMIRKALKEAELSIEEIDYINAHGTSTPLNDKIETMVLKEVFRDQAYAIPVSSTKSMIGHLLGAAGAVETIATLLPLEKNIIPPTINLEYPDPECDLNYVPQKAIFKEVKCAMKLSYGFGGHNACLILRRFEG